MGQFDSYTSFLVQGTQDHCLRETGEAYKVRCSKKNCSWDFLVPTEILHQVLAQAARDKITILEMEPEKFKALLKRSRLYKHVVAFADHHEIPVGLVKNSKLPPERFYDWFQETFVGMTGNMFKQARKIHGRKVGVNKPYGTVPSSDPYEMFLYSTRKATKKSLDHAGSRGIMQMRPWTEKPSWKKSEGVESNRSAL